MQRVDDADKSAPFAGNAPPLPLSIPLTVIRWSALYSTNQTGEARLCPDQCRTLKKRFRRKESLPIYEQSSQRDALAFFPAVAFLEYRVVTLADTFLADVKW